MCFLESECDCCACWLQVDCRKVLWELLALMAKHQGQLKVNYTPSTTSKAAGLLRGAVTAAAGAAVSAATAATGSDTGSAAGTPKAGAGSASATPVAGAAAGATPAAADEAAAADSELLKILTPELSSAVGPLSGLSILSHSVPQPELQATAMEMQVRNT